jgi:hypothetical protein
MRLGALLLALTVVALYPSGNAQGDPLSEVVNCDATSQDLANTLARVSWLSQLPVIAELAQPLPRIEIAEGTYIVKDLLRQIVLQAPSTTGRPTTK